MRQQFHKYNKCFQRMFLRHILRQDILRITRPMRNSFCLFSIHLLVSKNKNAKRNFVKGDKRNSKMNIWTKAFFIILEHYAECSMVISLMQLNASELVTCELRVLINELRVEKDKWRLKFGTNSCLNFKAK